MTTEAQRLAKQGIYSWEEFQKQLDPEELAAWWVVVNSARRGQMQEVRIGPLRYAVGANMVMRIA